MKKIHVIIPAAGNGTRMRPLSNNLSKTLIPINGKPILSWILDELNCIPNIASITIVTKEADNDIKQFIDNIYTNTNIGQKITCIPQNFKYNGPGGAIYTALEQLHYSESDGLLIWLSDTVCKYHTFDFSKNFLGTSKTPASESKRWCIAEYKNNVLVSLHDKQELNYSKELDALIGIYYMDTIKNYTGLIQESSTEIQISEFLKLYGYSNFIQMDLTNFWYDCGELETYYKSRAKLVNYSAREQSELVVDTDNQIITKYSNTEQNSAKLKSEYEWFKKCSEMQLIYIPKIIHVDNDTHSYTMSYESGTTLSDMFCYENIELDNWIYILSNVLNIYHNFFAKPLDSQYYNTHNIFEHIQNSFYIQKAKVRYTRHQDLYDRFITLEDRTIPLAFIEKLQQMSNEENVSNHICNYYDNHSLVHGDLHLGNILYDSILNKYTFLDPRGGTFWNNFTDANYDMAKIYHDIYCGYMLIMQNLYKIENNKVIFSNKNMSLMTFIESELDSIILSKYHYNPVYIKALAILLVFSCVPFHIDNLKHCQAFVLRSIELMKDFVYNGHK